LLDHVEAGNARLLDTVAGVLQRRLEKGIDKFLFDMNVNVDDEHDTLLLASTSTCDL
jgi:hypothetical protein